MKKFAFFSITIGILFSQISFGQPVFQNLDMEEWPSSGDTYVPLGWSFFRDYGCSEWWHYRHSNADPMFPASVHSGNYSWNSVGKNIGPCVDPDHQNHTFQGIYQVGTVDRGMKYYFNAWVRIEDETFGTASWSGNGQYFKPYIYVIEGNKPHDSFSSPYWYDWWEQDSTYSLMNTTDFPEGYTYDFVVGKWNTDWHQLSFRFVAPAGQGTADATLYLVTRASGTWTRTIWDDVSIVSDPPASVGVWEIYQ